MFLWSGPGLGLDNNFRATSANGCFWQVLSVLEETKCLALTVVFDDDNCSRVSDVSARNSLFVDKGGFKRIDSDFFELMTGDPLNMGPKCTCILYRKAIPMPGSY
jgi:hypothetical protein